MRPARLVIVLLLALAACSNEAPSEKAMRETFAAKRQAFEDLRTELCKLRYDLTISRDPSCRLMRFLIAARSSLET